MNRSSRLWTARSLRELRPRRRLQEKIDKLKRQMEQLREIDRQLHKQSVEQRSLIDPYARSAVSLAAKLKRHACERARFVAAQRQESQRRRDDKQRRHIAD